jgi:hypothetical protein
MEIEATQSSGLSVVGYCLKRKILCSILYWTLENRPAFVLCVPKTDIVFYFLAGFENSLN